MSANRFGAFSLGSGSSTRSSGTGSSISSTSKPSRSWMALAVASSAARSGCWSSYPQPQCLSRRVAVATGPTLTVISPCRPAISLASGEPRRRSIAAMPRSGPGARNANAQRQPVSSSKTAGISQIVRNRQR